MFGGHVAGQTKVMIEDVDFGSADLVTNDRQLPRADGIRFGRDYKGGRTIAFTMHIFGDNGLDGVSTLDQLTQVWMGDKVRGIPGGVSTLRIKYAGRTRRVYGRGRRFAPKGLRTAATGWAPVDADFKTIDHYFYDDEEKSNTVSIVPTQGGGLLAPLSAPLTTLAVSYAPGEILVGGTRPTWPVFVIKGPISLPTVEVVGEYHVSLGIGIAYDEVCVIDPRPWTRGVRMGDGASVAGALTPLSPPLSRISLAPGTHEVILSGLDETGTSALTVAWRDVYTSF